MQRIKDFWNKNTTSKIVVFVASIIILCCSCSIFISFLPESENPDSTSETDAVYTQAAATLITELTADAPVSAPEATNTPLPKPTNTLLPKPTNTPRPTETSVVSLENAEYAADIVWITSAYVEGLFAISDLTTAAGADVYLMLDEDWITEMATNLVVLQLLADEIVALDPPADMVPTHNWLLKVADETYLLVDNMVYGIDYFNVPAIEAAIQNIINIGEYTENATDAIPNY